MTTEETKTRREEALKGLNKNLGEAIVEASRLPDLLERNRMIRALVDALAVLTKIEEGP